MYITIKGKLKIDHNELAKVYGSQRDGLFDTIRTTLSQEKSTTLTELISGTWKKSNTKKFQNRYLYELCIGIALTELCNELIEEPEFTYRKK